MFSEDKSNEPGYICAPYIPDFKHPPFFTSDLVETDTPGNKIAICYSGGLDSMMMVKLARHVYPKAEITCVFYEHGQDSLSAEIAALPEDVHIRYVDWLDDNVKPVPKKSDPFAGAIYIPGRNLIFGALAACQYLPDQVWMGTLYDESNEQATDKNLVFLEKLNDLLAYTLSPFTDSCRVVFPFVDRKWTKTDALHYLIREGVVNKDDIANTTSCWHNKTGKPCGYCKQCVKRALIMRQFYITEEHQDQHPLHPGNLTTMNLIQQYEDCVDPNADEKEMQRMIKLWRANEFLI